MNSTSHGLSAQPETLDSDGYRTQLRAWEAELRPSGVVERALVERACRGAWRLDRCARFEDASAARRARVACDRHVLDERARVEDLGSRLLGYPDAPGVVSEPGFLVAELESTACGADWLLARWSALELALDTLGYWDFCHKVEAVRLLGLRPEKVLFDPHVAFVFLACFMADPAPGVFWTDCYEVHRIHPADYEDKRRVNALEVRMPESREVAVCQLQTLIRGEIDRLRTKKVEVLDARALADREGAEDLALLDVGPAASLLLRYETTSGRQLHRAINDFLKFRKATEDDRGEREIEPQPQPVEPSCANPAKRSQPPGEPVRGSEPREGEVRSVCVPVGEISDASGDLDEAIDVEREGDEVVSTLGPDRGVNAVNRVGSIAGGVRVRRSDPGDPGGADSGRWSSPVGRSSGGVRSEIAGGLTDY